MSERNYATQMDAARRGIVTPELETVARKERMTVEELLPLVASGKVVIPANRLHTCLDPEGIGSMLRTKINVNLGVSRDCKDYDVEMQKVLSAVKMGGEAIMDLSSHGNTQPFRRKLTPECPAMIGTVPVYDSVIHYQRDLDTLTAKDFHRRDPPPRGGRRGLCHPPLRHHPRDHRPDPPPQAEDEHRLPGRLAGVRLDVHDRGGEPLLRILRRDFGHLPGVRRHHLAGRRLPPRLPGRRHRRVPDRTSWSGWAS